jgi:GDP-4-dehydro-6-deoxy-D-mannose reductase
VRTLVTGAAGFVGRHLSAHLLESGRELFGLVHPMEGGKGSLGERVEVLPVDILDDAALSAAVAEAAPDEIYHLAAFSNPEGSLREARHTLETNILGAHHLLAAAESLGTNPKVLLVGSAQQYGRVPPEAQPIAEDREQAPLTPYAVSKSAQEILGLSLFRSRALPVSCTRSFNHTGPGQSDSYVCSSLARQVVEVEKGAREAVIRVGNLEARRDFTDVRDVVAAYRAILERGPAGRVYNVCRGEAVSIRDVLDELVELAETKVELVVDPERYHAADASLVLGDASRLIQETGWSPRYTLRDTLRDLLDDWRKRI